MITILAGAKLWKITLVQFVFKRNTLSKLDEILERSFAVFNFICLFLGRKNDFPQLGEVITTLQTDV